MKVDVSFGYMNHAGLPRAESSYSAEMVMGPFLLARIDQPSYDHPELLYVGLVLSGNGEETYPVFCHTLEGIADPLPIEQRKWVGSFGDLSGKWISVIAEWLIHNHTEKLPIMSNGL